MITQAQHLPVDHAQQRVAAAGNGSVLRYLIRWGQTGNCEAEILDELQVRPPKGNSEADPEAD